MGKTSAPRKSVRPARDALRLAADPIRKKKTLFKASINRETLANDILRTIGQHPTKSPLNHEMFPFLGHYINQDSDLGTIDMSKTNETGTEQTTASATSASNSATVAGALNLTAAPVLFMKPVTPANFHPAPAHASSSQPPTTAWDLTPPVLRSPTTAWDLNPPGLRLPPAEPSLIRFDSSFLDLDSGLLTIDQRPLTVDPRHLALELRPLFADPRPITRFQPPPVALPPTQARGPVYISKALQAPYPEMITLVLNFLRAHGMNETADEFEYEMTLRTWTVLSERDGVVIQAGRSLEQRLGEVMGRIGGGNTS